LSVSGNEVKKQAYRPLLPDVRFLQFNESNDLKWITQHTAGVIIETVQGDAGVRIPGPSFLMKLREKCSEVGALLIFDEIQCGIGRTGAHFAFEHFNVIPDVLTLGKALGGGMPIGALVASTVLLNHFTKDPALGHITTFGGHPVNCAAAAACLDVMANEIDYTEVERLGKLLEETVGKHPEIIETRRIGMMFAFDMVSAERVSKVVHACLERGLISFWFLSHPYSFRLSPPLNISEEEINQAGKIILEALEATKEN
jgi:acetylornithine/N-succinyldiaminopimelate aminotransferase